MFRILPSLLIGLALALGPVQARDVGQTLPSLALTDAAEAPQTLSPAVRRLYLSADRRGDKLLVEALQGLDQSALDAQQAVVIADISAAPGLIRRVIRRDLRERRYSTWIDQTGDTRRLLPYRAEQVVAVDLEDLRITTIRELNDAPALRALILGSP